MRTRKWTFVVIALLASPQPSRGQVIKTIKEHAAKKVGQHKQAADSTIVHAADKAVDSTLAKTGRPLDSLVSRGSAVVDTTLNRTEQTLSAGVGRLGGGGDHIVADLASGRVSLAELRFIEGTDRLDSTAMPVLQRLADALQTSAGNYLVEAHVASSGNPTADMQLSQRRAVAVKGALISLGVPPERLFAMGYGAAPNDPGQPPARIEVARMQ